MGLNSLKINLNRNKLGSNWLKSKIKSYLVRYHKFPEEKYLSEFFLYLTIDLVILIEQLIIVGIISFIFFYGVSTLIPKVNIFLSLGSGLLYLQSIFFLGVIILCIKSIIEWGRNL